MQAVVAKILSDTEIVLNVGSDHSVHSGQEFLIYEVGDEILDPVTKESLGQLEVQKGQVTVISVQPKMSIAQTGKRTYQRTEVVDPARSIAAIFGRTKTIDVTIQERLRVNGSDSDYLKRLTVRVGDLARSVD